VIAGAAAFIERVSRGATTLTATSPSPLPAAAASAWALNYVRERPELRGQLWANVTAARARLAALGWDLADTPAPIICLRSHLGRPPAAGRRLDLARLQAGLFERDICVAHVTSYTSTPAGGALRIAIFATHTAEQIDRLARELAALL
jgi:glycine C-acetyltransferase/8-amino-7-oxononanoate synthase